MKEPRYHYQNIFKHGLDDLQVEEALYDGWARRRRIPDREAEQNDRGVVEIAEEVMPEKKFYEVLGRSGGDFIHMVCEEREHSIWVFHARPMTDAEKRRYKRK